MVHGESHGEGSMAEKSSTNFVLQQKLLSFLGRDCFQCYCFSCFLALDTLFSVPLLPAALKSSLPIYLPNKSGSKRQVIALCALLLISNGGWLTADNEY